MQIVRASEMGFCFGVRRAVEMMEESVRERGPMVSLGSVVHNPQVVDRLRQEGLGRGPRGWGPNPEPRGNSGAQGLRQFTQVAGLYLAKFFRRRVLCNANLPDFDLGLSGRAVITWPETKI